MGIIKRGGPSTVVLSNPIRAASQCFNCHLLPGNYLFFPFPGRDVLLARKATMRRRVRLGSYSYNQGCDSGPPSRSDAK